MRNSRYWDERLTQLNEALFNRGTKTVRELEIEYRKAAADIERDIEIWLRRLATNNEISMAEARKLLKTGELEEFKWTVFEYIKKGEANAISGEWVKQLENASARVHISQMEVLQIKIRHNLEVLAAMQNKAMRELSTELLTEGYYRAIYEVQKGMGKGYPFATFNTDRVETIISRPWATDGKNFSDRIWGNKEKLIDELQTNLTQALIKGEAPDKTINIISDRLEVSRRQAGRLVMTESAYFAAEGQKSAYAELDVEQYQIVATLDTHTSEICQSLDGKVLDMKDYKAGVTAPPFHPWCRTVTIPYFEDNYTERAARGADGKTYYVDGNMKYEEWYNKHVKSAEKPKTIKTDGVAHLPKQVGFKGTDDRMQFVPKGSEITDVHIIAGDQVKSEYRKAQKISELYGGNKEGWVKKVGKIESAKYIFDIHWSEHPEIGAIEHKIVSKKVKS